MASGTGHNRVLLSTVLLGHRNMNETGPSHCISNEKGQAHPNMERYLQRQSKSDDLEVVAKHQRRLQMDTWWRWTFMPLWLKSAIAQGSFAYSRQGQRPIFQAFSPKISPAQGKGKLVPIVTPVGTRHHWGSNPAPPACRADAQPLGHLCGRKQNEKMQLTCKGSTTRMSMLKL